MKLVAARDVPPVHCRHRITQLETAPAAAGSMRSMCHETTLPQCKSTFVLIIVIAGLVGCNIC
jgi:hypothetical protein